MGVDRMGAAKMGRFIVFEGIDGCGKTTQLQRVGSWLAESGPGFGLEVGPPPYLTKEPGDTPLGQALRSLLLNTPWEPPLDPVAELLLYEADRAQHVAVLRSKLAAGQWVLCDRYTASTMAYQGYGRGLDLALVTQLNAVATGGLSPDLTIWLDLPLEASAARRQGRGAADRMEQADAAFHRRVYEGFVAQSIDPTWVRIDAVGDVDQVEERIRLAIREWGVGGRE
jgi:dTMP kinase